MRLKTDTVAILKEGPNIFISNSCIGACVLLPKVPSLKDNAHLDMWGLVELLKIYLIP